MAVTVTPNTRRHHADDVAYDAAQVAFVERRPLGGCSRPIRG